MNVADWLEATARATPQAPALFEGTRLHATYAGFEARDLNVNALGDNAAEAQRIFDRTGWQ